MSFDFFAALCFLFGHDQTLLMSSLLSRLLPPHRRVIPLLARAYHLPLEKRFFRPASPPPIPFAPGFPLTNSPKVPRVLCIGEDHPLFSSPHHPIFHARVPAVLSDAATPPVCDVPMFFPSSYRGSLLWGIGRH